MAYRSNRLNSMVTPGGIEPPTHCLEGSCSNPLSYGALTCIGRFNASTGPCEYT